MFTYNFKIRFKNKNKNNKIGYHSAELQNHRMGMAYQKSRPVSINDVLASPTSRVVLKRREH